MIEGAGAEIDVDWLGACRRAVEAIGTMLTQRSTTAQRARGTGTIGKGGDYTLEIDAAAEEIVFGELERLHDSGLAFSAISEERGFVDLGSPDVLVVIDPIDGSLNAKRGLAHHALSVAVALAAEETPAAALTMAEVVFGFVHDFGTAEEWRATLGGGAFLNGQPLDPSLPERRGPDGKLEVRGSEAVDPRWRRGAIDQLVDRAFRLRTLGAIAPSLCQVAATRLDGLVSLRRCRSVDAAAAQLIVREAGGVVSFPDCEQPLRFPLDLTPHSPVVAARNQVTLAELEQVCQHR